MEKVKEILFTTIVIVLSVMLFGTVYLAVFKKFNPMGIAEFELCENVAKEIYDGDVDIFEIPNNYYFKITPKSITVKLSSYSGDVKATIQNGELVFTRGYMNGVAIFISVVVGFMITSVFVFVIEYVKELMCQRGRF